MKATFTFHTDTLKAPWFRGLSESIRVFWVYLQAESDAAGWWFPDWDVAQAYLKLTPSLDPQQVRDALESAGQIIVHKSGWWELVEYQVQQYPRGLSDSQGFHRSVKRLLDQHQKRERALAAPAPPAGPSHRPGLDPASPQDQGQGSASDRSGDGSGKDAASIGDAGREQDPGPEPRPEAKTRAQAPDPVPPTGGPGGEPVEYEGTAREAAMGFLTMQLQGMGVDPITEPAKNALGALLDSLGLPAAGKALHTWKEATQRRTASSLALWVQDRQTTCTHPDTLLHRRWWTQHLPEGYQQKRWRCLVCGHHERHGEPFPAGRDDEGREGVAA